LENILKVKNGPEIYALLMGAVNLLMDEYGLSPQETVQFIIEQN
jgi:hypothetical protein